MIGLGVPYGALRGGQSTEAGAARASIQPQSLSGRGPSQPQFPRDQRRGLPLQSTPTLEFPRCGFLSLNNQSVLNSDNNKKQRSPRQCLRSQEITAGHRLTSRGCVSSIFSLVVKFYTADSRNSSTLPGSLAQPSTLHHVCQGPLPGPGPHGHCVLCHRWKWSQTFPPN